MGQDKTLNVHALLRSVCRRLGRRYSRNTLFFPDGVCTEIADDSDYHRTRRGYMRYRSAKVLRLNGRTWILARGERSGAYPADPYDSDIVAIEIDRQTPVDAALVKNAAEAIRQGNYFLNTVVCGLADGNLALYERSRFGSRMLPRLRPAADGLIAQAPKRDDRYLSLSTLQPVVTSSARYKPEAVRTLADMIVAVLNETR